LEERNVENSGGAATGIGSLLGEIMPALFETLGSGADDNLSERSVFKTTHYVVDSEAKSKVVHRI